MKCSTVTVYEYQLALHIFKVGGCGRVGCHCRLLYAIMECFHLIGQWNDSKSTEAKRKR